MARKDAVRQPTFGTRMRIPNHGRLLALSLLVLLTGYETDGARVAQADNPSHVISTTAVSIPASKSLSPAGEAALRAIVDEGRLLDLRRPEFADYATEVKEFYEAAAYKLPWIKGSRPTEQARVLIELLRGAQSKGLDAEDYDSSRWPERLQNLEMPNAQTLELDSIHFDMALTVSAMRYVSDLHIGRTNPKQFHFGLDIEHKRYDLSEFLRQKLVEAKDIQAVMATVEPPFPGYRRTLKALRTYLDLARQDNYEPLPNPKGVTKPGDIYTILPRLTRLLRSVGDLPSGAVTPDPGEVYQGALVDAVKHFQARHGLEANGRIDSHTVKELNTPLSRRVVQLQLTLERWRWLPHEFARPPIVVNIPEFRLRATDVEYRSALSMKVVVGRAYRHRTPVFASEMKQVIFRPYWNVPLSIQRAELAPLVAKNRSYLAEKDYEIVEGRGRVVDTKLVNDAIMNQLRSGELTIRQKPGPTNALGFVKFVLPNEYNVYLHGTPATALFSRARRDFSHGCIRVEDPVGLAVWALRDKPEWTPDRIRAAINGDKTTVVNLDKPIPVLILYGTAIVTEDGETCFFDDIYGHDAALERVLSERELKTTTRRSGNVLEGFGRVAQ